MTETITLNGKTFYSKNDVQSPFPIKIVVLQRGWVVVGRYERKGDQCFLYDASVIRNWGTTRGLGEIAKDGPTKETVLDKCFGIVEFESLTKVLSIEVEQEKWENIL